MNLLGVALFAILCALVLLGSVLYSDYQMKKTIKHIKDTNKKVINEIKQDYEQLRAETERIINEIIAAQDE